MPTLDLRDRLLTMSRNLGGIVAFVDSWGENTLAKLSDGTTLMKVSGFEVWGTKRVSYLARISMSQFIPSIHELGLTGNGFTATSATLFVTGKGQAIKAGWRGVVPAILEDHTHNMCTGALTSSQDSGPKWTTICGPKPTRCRL